MTIKKLKVIGNILNAVIQVVFCKRIINIRAVFLNETVCRYQGASYSVLIIFSFYKTYKDVSSKNSGIKKKK